MTSQDIVDIYHQLAGSDMRAMTDMIDEERKYNACPDDENRSYRDRAVENWEEAHKAFLAFAKLEWQ